MRTLAPMPTLVPMPSAGAPLATLVSQSDIINCDTVEVKASCKWYSPETGSDLDRTDPNADKMCPAGRIRVWKDTLSTKRREFSCVLASTTPAPSNQTEACHISNLAANPNINTSNWSSTNTTKYKNQCKNTWYKY